MSDLKNNLFYYATKELSQDAFICWLSSYALDGADNTDSELVRCAYKLVCEFMKKGLGDSIDCDKTCLKEVRKQFENIDVLLTVEYDDEVYKIIIEDKIHSSEHDDQLQRYKDKFENTDVHVIGIYFKTGFQSNLSVVNKAGYKVFNRNDVLNLLKDCKSENAILKNYREYWEDFERIVQSYKSLPLCEWPDWQAVNGFYDEMQSHLEKSGFWAGYDYVSNPSGGFWGLWYGKDDAIIVQGEVKASVYLQIETSWNYDTSQYDFRICTKLENKTNNKGDEDIAELKARIVDIQNEYGFERPSHLRAGTYMTVGVYSGVDPTSTYEKFKSTVMESAEQYMKLVMRIREEINYREG